MDFKKRAEELVAKMTLAEKISQMTHKSSAIERLGVPAYGWWNEALHGVARSGSATVFPQAIGMAASFDSELLWRVADIISTEARAKYNEYKKSGETSLYEGLTMWSPNINIFRDPRWGRGHETYGEDPYLTAVLGTAFVKGLQGEGKYRKVDATLKHYAVHSGPESERHSFNAVVNEKDLYETYLYAFKYCIEHAKPAAVMGAYNRTNGEACCASPTLLQKILREEFGFEGYVVSDCGAICDIHKNHKLTNNEAESAALAVTNGCDLNCGNMYPFLKAAVAADLISEETVTSSLVRLFEARFALGMFDTDCEYDSIPYDVIECEEHRAVNLKMAEESIVLLKNNGILPLKKEGKKRIAVIGPNADDKAVLLANYYGLPTEYTTILQGIIKESEARVMYAHGCPILKQFCDGYAPMSDVIHQTTKEALAVARNCDIIIYVTGLHPRLEGEESQGFDGDKPDIELPASQKELFAKLTDMGKPMIFVNVSGSCINLSEADEKCDAVIQCFYPGAEGGTALAKILFGKTSPSGRLPVTFYKSTDDLPDFKDYSMKNRTYKFFKGTPLYPFGHGLTYGDVTENWIDDKTVELTNNGIMDTEYAVLRYEYIPHKSLCGFKRVSIKKGETITVTFE